MKIFCLMVMTLVAIASTGCRRAETAAPRNNEVRVENGLVRLSCWATNGDTRALVEFVSLTNYFWVTVRLYCEEPFEMKRRMVFNIDGREAVMNSGLGGSRKDNIEFGSYEFTEGGNDLWRLANAEKIGLQVTGWQRVALFDLAASRSGLKEFLEARQRAGHPESLRAGIY